MDHPLKGPGRDIMPTETSSSIS